jgi:hypothetical protein
MPTRLVGSNKPVESEGSEHCFFGLQRLRVETSVPIAAACASNDTTPQVQEILVARDERTEQPPVEVYRQHPFKERRRISVIRVQDRYEIGYGRIQAKKNRSNLTKVFLGTDQLKAFVRKVRNGALRCLKVLFSGTVIDKNAREMRVGLLLDGQKCIEDIVGVIVVIGDDDRDVRLMILLHNRRCIWLTSVPHSSTAFLATVSRFLEAHLTSGFNLCVHRDGLAPAAIEPHPQSKAAEQNSSSRAKIPDGKNGPPRPADRPEQMVAAIANLGEKSPGQTGGAQRQ